MKKWIVLIIASGILSPLFLGAQVLTQEEINVLIKEQIKNSPSTPTQEEINELVGQAEQENRARAEQSGSIKPTDITGSFSISISPQSPRPGEAITVSLGGGGVNLDSALIRWSVNGSPSKSGRGEKSLTLTAGALGSRTTIHTIVETTSDIFEKSIVIMPAEVDILWQGNGFTIPFYKGRTLWSKQSKLILLAVPQGLGANTGSLIYRWSRNGTVLGSLSGTGKNSLSLSGSILSTSQTIKVEVFSAQNVLLASASVSLSPTSPQLLAYENSPLYGFLFHKAVGSEYQMNEREVTFTAFPLFFSTNTRTNSSLNYEWGTNTGGLENKNSVTYRTPDNGAGSSNISLKVYSKSAITQDTKKGFLVKFGQNNE